MESMNPIFSMPKVKCSTQKRVIGGTTLTKDERMKKEMASLLGASIIRRYSPGF